MSTKNKDLQFHPANLLPLLKGEEFTAQADGQPVEQPKKPTKVRKKAIEAAERRLQKAGV